jgi:hypothetical protein
MENTRQLVEKGISTKNMALVLVFREGGVERAGKVGAEWGSPSSMHAMNMISWSSVRVRSSSFSGHGGRGAGSSSSLS